MATLTVQTPVGEFTRKTIAKYTHVVVWDSPRARAELQHDDQSSGVGARWQKDRGYGVTWHCSLAAASAAAYAGYRWDRAAKCVGVFEVQS